MLDGVIDISLHTKAQTAPTELIDDAYISDEQFVRAVLAGDEQAFAEIFERYKRPMTRVVSRFFREISDIDECVQLCFTKAYFSLSKYRGGEDGSFPAWMTRIAVNICYDEFRRRQRKAESLFTDMSDQERDYLEATADGRTPSIENRLVAAQLTEKILASLDIRDRMALTLIYSEDYSLREVANSIGISTSNLKSRLFRCRNQLRIRFDHLFR
jgi:RNA polymerase sigma factor (sigma-70 family)